LELPDNIKSQILDLDQIKESIKFDAKEAESILREMEMRTGLPSRLTRDVAASFVNVINDPMQWLAMLIPTPTKFIPGVVVDAAISGATEGIINHYFLNPRKKELEVHQTELKQAIIEGAAGGAVASSLFRGIGRLADKFLMQDSKSSASGLVADRILNDPVPDISTKELLQTDLAKLSEFTEKQLLDLDSRLKSDVVVDDSDISEIINIIPELENKVNTIEGLKIKSEESVKLKIARYLEKHSDSYTASSKKDPVRAFRFYIDEFNPEVQRYTGTMEYFLDDVLSTFSEKEINANPNINQNFIREIYDVDTKDFLAKKLKLAFSDKLSKFVLDELKALGVDIKPLQHYFPQTHNKRLMTQASKENWVNFTHDLVDWKKVDKQIAKKIFDENDIKTSLENEFIESFQIKDKKNFLEQIYDLVISDGIANLDINGYAIKSPLYKRLLYERTLHFDGADNFLKYSEKFGNSETILDGITQYIDRFSKTLATLKMFGPNPTTTFSWVKQLLLKNQKKKINFSLIDSAFEKITRSSSFVSDNLVGNIYTSFYSMHSAALLSGSSTLAYLTDPITSALTASYNGLNILRTILRAYTPGLGISKDLARRTGLIIEHYGNIDAGRVRYDIAAVNAKKFFNWTMKYSGMNYITDRGRWIFSTEFMATLREDMSRSFNDSVLKKSMEFYGITAQDRDFLIKNGKILKSGKLELLSPMSLYDLSSSEANRVAEKFMRMILNEQQRAVPSYSLISSLALTGKTRPDTISGMMLHSFASLKNFPLTIFRQHLLQRAIPLLISDRKISYLAGLLLSSTLMGALYVQLQQLSRGKTPMDMSNKEFWLRALDSGGGLGILGMALTTDNKNAILKEITGSTIGGISDAADISILEIIRRAKGQKSNYGKKISDFIRDNMPLRRHAALNLIIDRYLVDQIQLALDPDGYKHFKSSSDYIRKKYNQRYWWKPGEVIPG
jgi:hypothetical protein